MTRTACRPALIHNPSSRLNRGRRLPVVADLIANEPSTQSELETTLRNYADREVDLLIVSGGDGTLRDVLSALVGAYGSTPLPAIALVAAGNSNLVASDVGACPPRVDAVAQLVAAAKRRHWRQDLLRQPIQFARPEENPVLGFFAGAAAFRRATQFNHEHVSSGGRLSIATTLAAAMWSAVRGVGDWAEGDWLSIGIDQARDRAGPRFLFLATSLQRLTLGLWPFWGQQGELHYLDVDACPPNLGRSLLPLMRGKPTPAMLRGAYHSNSAAEIRLHMHHPLIIDGEPFSSADGHLTLSAGPSLHFVSI